MPYEFLHWFANVLFQFAVTMLIITLIKIFPIWYARIKFIIKSCTEASRLHKSSLDSFQETANCGSNLIIKCVFLCCWWYVHYFRFIPTTSTISKTRNIGVNKLLLMDSISCYHTSSLEKEHINRRSWILKNSSIHNSF